jgi:hypothetical protein
MGWREYNLASNKEILDRLSTYSKKDEKARAFSEYPEKISVVISDSNGQHI